MAGIAEIIRCEDLSNGLVWKHPIEDFNSLTQLIVEETQEAIFFKNGQALDLFGPGRYTLETENLPLLKRLLNRTTHGVSPFHCEVYFFNKIVQFPIKWGTDSQVQYMEPAYGFPISIGASGEMSVRVIDSRKLLLKLTGTNSLYDQTQLSRFFRSFLMTKVKSYIGQYMQQKDVSIFDIDSHMEEFSDTLKAQLQPDFETYGVRLERFFVTNLAKPDGERQYETFKDLHFRQYADIARAKLQQQTELIHAETEAQKTVLASKAMAAKRSQEGYTYQQERGFDVAQSVAENENIGQLTGLGVGLGSMAAVGGVMSNLMGSSMQDTLQAQPPAGTQFCENCGAPLSAGSAFCEQCGTAVSAPSASVCKKCGYQFQRPGRFCPKCGTKREE